MELSHEDIVTRLLSKREILQHNNNSNQLYSTNPSYDLNTYLKNKKSEPGRFGEKYVFVK